jgi:hypothetical protein
MNKPVPPEKTTIEIEVNTPPELMIPRFCNMIGAGYSKDRGEVILDFVYFDERFKQKEKIVGHQISKIVLTINTAKNLQDLLNRFVKDSK